MFEITLPWPPSINTYYGQRVVRAKTGPMAGKYIATPFLTERARQYREDVLKLSLGRKCISSGSALAVHVLCYPPDKRSRDLGNLDKGLMDALQHAGIIRNDYDYWDYRFTRQCLSAPPGRVVVRIWPINIATMADSQPGDDPLETTLDKAVRGMTISAQACEEAYAALGHNLMTEPEERQHASRKLFKMGNATEHVPRRRSPPAPTQQQSMIDDEKPF